METRVEPEAFSIDTAGHAAAIRASLGRLRVLAVALVGPPGAGKTALIEATARQLRGKARVAVIAMNPAADRDADRVSRYCDQVKAVKTAAPDAGALRTALRQIDLNRVDLLLVESMGGIAGEPQLGQDRTVTVLSVAGGDDNAAVYAQLLAQSTVLLLTQADLRRQVRFDLGVFRADVRRINPAAQLIEVSAFEMTGLPRWLAWLDQQRREKDPMCHPLTPLTNASELHFE
jgi:hydrogenase nickel incorporation protein HypB